MAGAANIIGWQEGPDMQITALGSCVIKFPDGAFLVFGGDMQGGQGGHNLSVLVQPNGAFTQDVILMNQKRAYHGAVLMNDGRIFTLGGYGAGNTAEIFDPIGNTWTAVASCPSGVGSLAAFAIVPLADNTVLVMGGNDGSLSFAGQWAAPLNTVFRYHPGTDSWTTEAAMAHPRAGAIAFNISVSGEVIICGGQDGASSGRSDSEIWNGTSWSSGGTMPGGARVCPIGFSLGPANNRRVVTGGQAFVNPASEQPPIKSTAIFEDGIGWIAGGDMITARSAAALRGEMVAAQLSTGQAVIYGGYDDAVNTNALPNAEYWEPNDNNWHALPNVFPTAVDGAPPWFIGTLAWGAPMAVGLVNDVVMQVGGDANSNLYAPSSRTFLSKTGIAPTNWHYGTNFIPATDGDAVANGIGVLLVAGWTIQGAGDGTTYYPTGHVLTATQWNNNSAWMRIQDPAGGTEYIIQRKSATASGGNWSGLYSVGARFITGSPSATVAPTASDQQQLLNNQQWFNSGDAFLAAANDTPEVTGILKRYAVCWLGYDGAGHTGNLWMIDPIDQSLSSPITTWDADPQVIVMAGSFDDFLAGPGPAYAFANFPALFGPKAESRQPFNINRTLSDPANGNHVSGRVLWEQNGLSGLFPKGYSTILLWSFTATSGQTLLTLNSPKDRMVMDQTLSVPWNGLAPVMPSGSINGPLFTEVLPITTVSSGSGSGARRLDLRGGFDE